MDSYTEMMNLTLFIILVGPLLIQSIIFRLLWQLDNGMKIQVLLTELPSALMFPQRHLKYNFILLDQKILRGERLDY